jgi:hypothetical protein
LAAAFSQCSASETCESWRRNLIQSRSKPSAFGIRNVGNGNWEFDVLSSDNKLIGGFVIPHDKAVCSAGTLQISVYSGLGRYGAGSWALGHQTINVSIERSESGHLLMNLSEVRKDAVLFVVPAFEKTSEWLIFEASSD